MTSKFQRRKKRLYDQRETLTPFRLEKLLEQISLKKSLEIKEKPKIFYDSKNPEVIRKRWIRNYQIKLKEHNNYTNYNIVI